MKRFAGFLVIALATAGLGMAQEAVPAAPTAHPYYPLKAGSTWTYEVQGGPITVKVAGTETVKGAPAFKLETTAGNKVSATEVVGLTKEGIVRYNVNGLAPEKEILFLPIDPAATKEWSVDTKVQGQEIKGTFKVTKEKVTVPAGTYEDCFHVKGADMKIGGTTTTVEYWFAKDVGVVKLKFTLGSQDATLELKEYKAGGK